MVTTSSSSPNPNLATFDKAVALIESTPRQFKDLPSGETISYREYNKGQPYTLVMLPGYLCDDVLFSIIAVLPEFQDHHIIAVNPRGWNGSSMNTPIYSHEDNADEVMELLKLLKIENAMVGGYSSGGGIAFHMAQKYPHVISTAFLIHSIPLDGMKFDHDDGKISSSERAETLAAGFPDDISIDVFHEQLLQTYSSNPDGSPPKTHKICSLLHKAAGPGMRGKKEVLMANLAFNVTPVKSSHCPQASDALKTLKSKIVIIHGATDKLIPPEQVEFVTKLAIAESWAPEGMLSFYEDGEGHMLLIDNPTAFASIYRKAFDEQVLSKAKCVEVDEGKTPSWMQFCVAAQ